MEEYSKLSASQLIKNGKKGIASWSKAIVVHDPNEYAIFDARVAISLNCIQKLYGLNYAVLFPVLPSRNKIVALGNKLIRATAKSESWEKAYEALLEFTKREGHCRVPPRLTTNGIKIGNWVRTQRSNKQRLSAEQVSLLDSVGISWDPYAEQWEKAYELLKKFVLREGHCRVVRTFKTNGFKLGVWVFQQRQRKGRLTPDKIRKLDSLGFSWDPFSEQWDAAFETMQSFYKREGHTRVNFEHVENGVNLGTWVSDQRKKKSRLTNQIIRC